MINLVIAEAAGHFFDHDNKGSFSKYVAVISRQKQQQQQHLIALMSLNNSTATIRLYLIIFLRLDIWLFEVDFGCLVR